MQTTNTRRLRRYRELTAMLGALALLWEGRVVAQTSERNTPDRTRYRVIDLGTLGGTSSGGWGTNDRRWVSGISSLPGDAQC